MITASVIFGRFDAGEMVCSPEPAMAKLIVSVPAVVFASRMACRNVPAPESATLLTTNVAADALVASSITTTNKPRPYARRVATDFIVSPVRLFVAAGDGEVFRGWTDGGEFSRSLHE